MTSGEFKEARVRTWQARYGEGVTSPSKSPAVLRRQEETCLRNRGTRYPMQSEAVRQKAEATKAARYGDPHFFSREKARETCSRRYGRPYYTQTQAYRDAVSDPAKRAEAARKATETMRRNGSYGRSRAEDEAFRILSAAVPDKISRQDHRPSGRDLQREKSK